MNKSIISPEDLAKRTKDSARTVSLRIKEKTWLGFEQLAKDNNTTANALIGELADYYIESLDGGLDLSDKAVAINKFKTFLERETRKICRWTIDDAVVHINMNYAHATVDGNKYNLSYLGNLREIFKEMCLNTDGEEYVNYEFDFGTHLGDSITVVPTLKEKATYDAGAYDPAWPIENALYIPIEKAPDIISLFASMNKYLEKNAIDIDYDIDLMDELVEIIDKYDYRYIEDDYTDEGPEIQYDETARRDMLHGIKQAIIDHVEKDQYDNYGK